LPWLIRPYAGREAPKKNLLSDSSKLTRFSMVLIHDSTTVVEEVILDENGKTLIFSKNQKRKHLHCRGTYINDQYLMKYV
jgi:hypothetical protein